MERLLEVVAQAIQLSQIAGQDGRYDEILFRSQDLRRWPNVSKAGACTLHASASVTCIHVEHSSCMGVRSAAQAKLKPNTKGGYCHHAVCGLSYWQSVEST